MRTLCCLFGLIATAVAHPGHEITTHGPAHAFGHLAAIALVALTGAALLVGVLLITRRRSQRQRA